MSVFRRLSICPPLYIYLYTEYSLDNIYTRLEDFIYESLKRLKITTLEIYISNPVRGYYVVVLMY